MRAIAPFAALSLAACAAAPTAAVAPIEPLRLVAAELLVQPAPRGLEREPFLPWIDPEDAEPTRCVSIRARFLALEPELAERHLGAGARGLIAYVVPRERAEWMLAELGREPTGFEVTNETELALPEGQDAPICVFEQRAFVAGFTLRSDGRASLADPRVDVATQGTQLVASGVLDESGERVALDLRLDACRLAEAFDERVVELGGARVTLQQPRGLLRSLSTRVTLARDEALLIGGASLSEEGSSVAAIVLVEAEALPAGG